MGHGVVWIAKKAAELGYQIPSTISGAETPLFNFWLERYMESPIERYILSFFESGEFKPPETDDLHIDRKMFDEEMKTRKWFEAHLEDFFHELDGAVDYITDYLFSRKNIKRCFKQLPGACYDHLMDLIGPGWELEGESDEENKDGLMRLSKLVLRSDLAALKQLEEEGYIIVFESDIEEEKVQELLYAFTDYSEGKPFEYKEDDKDKEDSISALNRFLFFIRILLIVPQGFPEMLKDILSDRERIRLEKKQLVQDVMKAVQRFYILLPLADILKIVHSVQKLFGAPETEFLDLETMTRMIQKQKEYRIAEVEGVTYAISVQEYHDFLIFRKKHGSMSLQEYRTAVEADNDLYDTIYEYLSFERLENNQPRIWDPAFYASFSKFGFLMFKEPYYRLFALLAVILLEARSINNSMANFFNASIFGHGDDADALNDPFRKETESAESSLQRAYEVTNILGNALCDNFSPPSLMDLLREEISLDGLKKEIQDKLAELLRLCCQVTPNSDRRGDLPDHEDD